MQGSKKGSGLNLGGPGNLILEAWIGRALVAGGPGRVPTAVAGCAAKEDASGVGPRYPPKVEAKEEAALARAPSTSQ